MTSRPQGFGIRAWIFLDTAFPMSSQGTRFLFYGKASGLQLTSMQDPLQTYHGMPVICKYLYTKKQETHLKFQRETSATFVGTKIMNFVESQCVIITGVASLVILLSKMDNGRD